jgi:membrane associated rhomboid family serine protease
MYRTGLGQGGLGPFSFQLTPWVKRLIVANTIVFLVTWSGLIPRAVAYEYLGFNASQTLREPWTIITYMFVHANFFHVFFNMLMLFFFGPPLERRWGGREFIKYYTITGVGGAVFTLVSDLLAGGGGTIIGASGAVFGVMLAYAMNWPDSLIWIYAIFPIKAKYFILILGAITFFSAVSGTTDGIAQFAHLGGLVVGYVYLKKGWQIEARWTDLRRGLRRRRLKVVRGGASPPPSPPPASRRPRDSRDDEEARILDVVDRLLDKIAAQGIDSLTPEERRFLDEVSRRRRAQHQVRH